MDSKEIAAGDSISERVESGLKDADALCLCLSPHSVASAWVQREYRAALSMQLASTGRQPRIVPLLVAACEIPPLLRDIRHADFSFSYRDGFRGLCAGLDLDPLIAVPYRRLVRHIESREPLADFVAGGKRGERSDLPYEWASQMFKLLREDIATTRRLLRKDIDRGERLSVASHESIRSRLPNTGTALIVLSPPIEIEGGFELIFGPDEIEPWVKARSGLIEFLDQLDRYREVVLSGAAYLVPRLFRHHWDSFPDGGGEEVIDMRALLKRVGLQ